MAVATPPPHSDAERDRTRFPTPPRSTDGSGRRTRIRRTPRRRTPRWLPYALIFPAVLVIVVVQGLPLIAAVAMSFMRVNQFTIGDWIHAPWIGLHNYQIAVGSNNAISRALLVSFGYTAAYTVVVVVVSWILGMAAAVFLADSLLGRRFIGSAFLLTYALPTFVAVTLWTFMFQPHGAINDVLGTDTFWFAGEKAFWAMCINTVWRTWPFAFLMLLPAVQSVPTELYEAVRVDGASRWREFISVTLPLTRNVGYLLILIVGFWTFSDFTTPYLMFSSAAPTSADVLSLVIYRTSFVNLNFGLGSAMSLVMVAFLIGASLLYVRALHLDVGDVDQP